MTKIQTKSLTALACLVTMPACSLIIDTNADGVIFTGGTSARSTKGGKSGTSDLPGDAGAGGSLGGTSSATAGALSAGGIGVGAIGGGTGIGSVGGSVAGAGAGGTSGTGGGALAGATATGGVVVTTGGSASGGQAGSTAVVGGGGVAATGGAATGGAPICANGEKRSCSQAALLGSCALGEQTCSSATWSACSVTAKTSDTCEKGNDDNCNGEPNEGCACVEGEKQGCGPSVTRGICVRGEMTCSGQKWGQCVGATYALSRDCTSAADNDCDGNPDNTADGICECVPGNSRTCGTHPGLDGVGICKAGTQTCDLSADKTESHWSDCVGSVGPSDELCTSAQTDENCDGRVNESPPCKGYLKIAPGESHTCAVVTDGTVRCWGLNTDGQIGDNTNYSALSPTPVAGVSGATDISSGWTHSCAIVQNGDVMCWGGNLGGSLGDGTYESRNQAILVGSGVTTVNLVGAGYDHTCAGLHRGIPEVTCWGSNFYGQLGDPLAESGSSTFGLPSGIWNGALSVSSAYDYTCVVQADNGSVKCWGANGYGQLGDGTQIERRTPVAVLNLTTMTKVSAKLGHTCALRSDGTVWCWGANKNGQLGDGTNVAKSTPTQVPSIAGAGDIAVGRIHACALVSGSVLCWGNNELHQLGSASFGTTNASPQAVPNLSNVRSIVAGSSHTCAVLNDNTARCWGDNQESQLGNGNLGVAEDVVRVRPPG